MTETIIAALPQSFKTNLRLMNMQIAGLSHADSVIQPPFRANSMNWVLGHLAVSQDAVLAILGVDPILSPEQTERYQTESEPVVGDGDDIMALEELLNALEQGYNALVTAFERLPLAYFEEEVGEGANRRPRWRSIYGLMWHMTYHTGQLELLRQLTGVNDKVV